MAQTNSECNSSLISTRDLGPVGCDVEDPHKVRAERCGDARDNSPSDLLLQAFRGLELSSCEHQALPAALSCSYGGPCEGEVVISTEVVKVRFLTLAQYFRSLAAASSYLIAVKKGSSLSAWPDPHWACLFH